MHNEQNSRRLLPYPLETPSETSEVTSYIPSSKGLCCKKITKTKDSTIKKLEIN